MGPLMLDCQAEELAQEEKEKLAHPVVGGVILFTRNYHDKRQLRALVESIREHAKKPVLIGVDHEGGAFNDLEKVLPRYLRWGRSSGNQEREMKARPMRKRVGWCWRMSLKRYISTLVLHQC